MKEVFFLTILRFFNSQAKNIMQFVPIIPRQKISFVREMQVKGITAVKAAKPAQERTLPPLLSHTHAPLQQDAGLAQHERRKETQLQERRLSCRRVRHLPILEELRSAIDRRRHNQRVNDFQLHIDEEA